MHLMRGAIKGTGASTESVEAHEHVMREAIKGTGASTESAEAHEHLLLWLETISFTPPGSDQGLDSAVTSARYSAFLSEVDFAVEAAALHGRGMVNTA